jgi:hypothetical protein
MLRKFNLLAIVLAIIAVIAACGDDPADPDNGEDPEVSPYSGIFVIESELVSNNCVEPVPPTTMTTVVVEGDSILFGGFPGDWDEVSLTGTGDTPEYTVPVDPPECYAYYTIVYEIVYVNADSFSGTYGANYRKDPGCPNPDPCSFLYNITGSR